MTYRENPLLGRKVFFLNPPLSIENYVIECLKGDDYEVYVIPDYTSAKPVLRLYENAICFIFIDDGLTLEGWYNFIKSFEEDESLKSVFLGVISIKTKPKDQERFLMDLKLPGGFVMMDKKQEELYHQLDKILDINGARGVRKCIRLVVDESVKDVNGYFSYNGLLYSFKLVDISVLGFAAVTPVKMASIFIPGTVIKNVSFTMGRYSFVTNVIVLKKEIKDSNCTVIMLLDKKVAKSIKKDIHDFIYEILGRRHKDILNEVLRDMTNYNSYKRYLTTDEQDSEGDISELKEEVKEGESQGKVTEVKKSGEEQNKDSDKNKTEESDDKAGDCDESNPDINTSEDKSSEVSKN